MRFRRLAMPPNAHLQLQLRLPLLWLLALLLAALFLPNRAWNTLLVGFGGMVLTAYVWVRVLANGLSAARQLRFGWVSVGDRLEELLEIRNDGSLPALWVEVVDESNVPGYTAAVVRSVGFGSADRWRQSAVCHQRGQFHLGPWAIRASDPFGIFLLVKTYPKSSEVIIHPPIHAQLSIPLPTGQRSGQTRASRRAWQATINAAGVRDYRPDDPLQWIHWRTTARKGALHVREFDLDAAGDIWLLLDLQAAVQLGAGLDGTEEHAVLLAASLAARGLSENRPMGIAAYGRFPYVVPPGTGEGQRWRLLRALALVQADGDVGLQRMLQDFQPRAGRGTAVLILTASGSPEWLPELLTLPRRGIQPHVILLDRASFGGSGGQGLQTAVRQLGVSCSLIRQGEVGQPLEEQSRRGHWEFIVTGTGKVVQVDR